MPLLQVSHVNEDELLDDCFLRCSHRDVIAYSDVQVNEESSKDAIIEYQAHMQM